MKEFCSSKKYIFPIEMLYSFVHRPNKDIPNSEKKLTGTVWNIGVRVPHSWSPTYKDFLWGMLGAKTGDVVLVIAYHGAVSSIGKAVIAG